MTPLMRALALFAGIFFVVNLGFDAYRAGGLTAAAFASAFVTTAIATLLYWLFLRWQASRKDPD
ncbi:hypothetical protein ACK8OR_13425 [Jannaschia sp. KMU-145]|uniref:hypothetical protein n=1 Tax=Jannaschia halovivens TaxID=3388667 RepID=UPI00396B064F